MTYHRIVLAALLVIASSLTAAGQESLDVNRLYLGSAPCALRAGSGTPEGAVTGTVCDTYWRTDTGTIYTKTSGTGNTGWTLVVGHATAPTFSGLTVTGTSALGDALTFGTDKGTISWNATHFLVRALAGTPALKLQTNAGAVDALTLANTGAATFASSVTTPSTVFGEAGLSTGGSGARATLRPLGSGLFQFNNSGETGGFTLDAATTADTMRVRNRANSAAGNLTAGAGTFSTSVLVGGGNAVTIPNGVGSLFTPALFSTATSGVVGVGVAVNDGTNNRRAGLYLNQTDGVWGLSHTYTSGDIPFVLDMAGNERLRITAGGIITVRADSADTTTPFFILSSTDGSMGTSTKYGIEFRAGAPVSRILQAYDGTFDLVFEGYSGSATAEYMRIAQGGAVSITAAAAQLSLVPSTRTSTVIGAKDSRVLLLNDTSTGNAGGDLVFGYTDTDVDRIGAVGWAAVSNGVSGGRGRVYIATKTNDADTTLVERLSVHADGSVGIAIGSTTPSYTLHVGGTLGVAGSATFSATATFSTISSHLTPTTTDTYDLGRYDRYFDEGFISTLNSVVYRESTATLFGGYSKVGKQAGSFAADVAAAATTINFGQTMTPNDWVEVRAHDTGGTVKVEYLTVGTLVSGTTYNVTRDLAGAHGTDPAWASGTPFLVLGASGDGRIEMLAYDGKPRILFTQQGANYNAQNDRAVVGNLNGYFGYASDVYGLAAGDSATTWIKVDPTNGVRIGNAGNTKISLDASGNAAFSGSVTAAAGTIGGFTIGASALSAGTDADYVALMSGGTNAIQVGDSTFADAEFSVTSAGVVKATSGTVGGWTLGASTLTGGNATLANTGNLTLGSGNDVLRASADDATYRLWTGHATAASAPFRVTKAGAVTMTSATITGTDITMGSGAGSYANTSAMKWARPAAGSFGQTGDVFAAWPLTAAGEHHLYLQNKMVGTTGGGSTTGKALTVLSASGWNAAGNTNYTEATIALSSGGTVVGGPNRIDFTATTSAFSGVVMERGRATAIGEWTSVAYDAGNFSTNNGGTTWTIQSGDQTTFAYTLVGKTMCVNMNLSGFSISGSAATQLRVALPASAVSAHDVTLPTKIADNGTAETGGVVIVAGGSQMLFRRQNAAAAWSNSTDNSNLAVSSACFAIQ